MVFRGFGYFYFIGICEEGVGFKCRFLVLSVEVFGFYGFYYLGV